VVLERASASQPVICLLDECRSLDRFSWELIRAVDDMQATAGEEGGYSGRGVTSCIVSRPMHHKSLKYPMYQRSLRKAIRLQNRLVVGPLEGQDFVRFLTEHLGVEGPVPEALTQYLFNQSQGNPYFVQELNATLLASGNMYILDGVVHLGAGEGSFRSQIHALQKLAVPAPMGRIIKSELDHLTPHEQMVLKIASVLQAPFPLSILRQAFSDSVANVPDDAAFLAAPQGVALARLEADGVLYRAPDDGVSAEVRFHFRSPVMLQVCSKLLLNAQKSRISSSGRRASTLGPPMSLKDA
jgi:predicted ATPase